MQPFSKLSCISFRINDLGVICYLYVNWLLYSFNCLNIDPLFIYIEYNRYSLNYIWNGMRWKPKGLCVESAIWLPSPTGIRVVSIRPWPIIIGNPSIPLISWDRHNLGILHWLSMIPESLPGCGFFATNFRWKFHVFPKPLLDRLFPDFGPNLLLKFRYHVAKLEIPIWMWPAPGRWVLAEGCRLKPQMSSEGLA